MSDQLTEATARLERALAMLEGQARARPADAPDTAPHDEARDDDLFAGGLGVHDNELRAAAQQASDALARAAEALSAAIGEED